MKKLLLTTFAFSALGAVAQLPVGTSPQNRKAVLEEFTGIHCGYCPDGHRIGTAMHTADPNNVILINIHSGSFANASAGEPDFKTTEGTAIDGMPGMGITGYPAGDMNREVLVGSVMAASRGSWNTMANTIKSQPAYCNVALQGTVDPQTRVLTVKVEVYYTANSPVPTNSINVFLLESKIHGIQSDYGNYNPTNWNADGSYNHNHVLRNALTTTFGTTIPNTTSGSLYAGTFTYTIPSTYGAAGKTTVPNFENLELVAFVTESDRKIINADDGPLYLKNDAKAISALVPVVCGNSFAPVVTIKNNGISAITDLTITPSVDGAIGAITPWSGNLLPGASTTVALNSINSGTVGGNHFFTYTITAANPADYIVNNNSYKTNFFIAGPALGTPVYEGFLLAAFPPAGWANINPDQGTASWTRNTLTGGYFQAPMMSAKYDFFSNTVIGDVDDLYLPSMDLSGATAPEMSFDYAYSQRTANTNDKLEVLVSDNCGTTWTSFWSKSGSTLATAAGNPVSTAYLPQSADFGDWQTAIVSLTGFNKNNVMVKFQTTNDNGNNLYIDNVNLSQKNPNSVRSFMNGPSFNLNVFPNPASGVANISIEGQATGFVKVAVMNAIGQLVYTETTMLKEGTTTLTLNVKDYPTGIYNVVVDSKQGSVTKKLNVNN